MVWLTWWRKDFCYGCSSCFVISLFIIFFLGGGGVTGLCDASIESVKSLYWKTKTDTKKKKNWRKEKWKSEISAQIGLLSLLIYHKKMEPIVLVQFKLPLLNSNSCCIGCMAKIVSVINLIRTMSEKSTEWTPPVKSLDSTSALNVCSFILMTFDNAVSHWRHQTFHNVITCILWLPWVVNYLMSSRTVCSGQCNEMVCPNVWLVVWVTRILKALKPGIHACHLLFLCYLCDGWWPSAQYQGSTNSK